jgi:predicted DNA-binding transcriptional regulator YafY
VLRLVASQVLEPPGREAEDGGGWVRLRLRYPAEGAARASLLAFGADVEVLEPARLRRGMLDAARAVAGLYARDNLA